MILHPGEPSSTQKWINPLPRAQNSQARKKQSNPQINIKIAESFNGRIVYKTLMVELVFTCPHCQQNVRCDSALSGSQITCPGCQRSIAVPSPTPQVAGPAERAVQIKVSTLQKIALIAGILAAIAVVALAIYSFTGPKSVTFKGSIDGTDVVKICGHRLWIEHQSFQLPTRLKVNGGNWAPAWNGSISTAYHLRRAFSPGNPGDLKLHKLHGRGDVTIIQMPSPANNQTLAIQLDDGPFGGAAFYEFTLSW
jgi:hypothetical protein